MALPQFQSNNTPFQLMQSAWASQINPVLALPMSSPSILKDIPIASGVNVINHLLGRTPIGWIISDKNAAIDLYRTEAFNNLKLTLTSTGAGTISLIIF